MGELNDRLCIHAKAIVDDRLAQVADDRDVFVAPHDAAIGVLIQLYAATPAILRSLASCLGVRECMRQRELRTLSGGDAEARRHSDRRAFVGESDLADCVAQAAEE